MERVTTACPKAKADHDVGTSIIVKRESYPIAPDPFGVVTRP
jgi:hypothetical protein